MMGSDRVETLQGVCLMILASWHISNKNVRVFRHVGSSMAIILSKIKGKVACWRLAEPSTQAFFVSCCCPFGRFILLCFLNI
jgi:hypothetical protein